MDLTNIKSLGSSTGKVVVIQRLSWLTAPIHNNFKSLNIPLGLFSVRLSSGVLRAFQFNVRVTWCEFPFFLGGGGLVCSMSPLETWRGWRVTSCRCTRCSELKFGETARRWRSQSDVCTGHVAEASRVLTEYTERVITGLNLDNSSDN